jgi:DNA-binding MarR family transcriptional regulator
VAEYNQRSFVAGDASEILSQTIRARRRRSDFLSGELFADPAWDILLELSLARAQGRAVTVEDLLRSSQVGESTALRWLEKLEQDGWVRRDPDPSDRRRSIVDLSERAAAAMQAWISDLVQSWSGRPDDGTVTSLLERIDRARRDS